jgi:hypothetical protein
MSDCANRSPLILAGSRKAEWVSFPAIAQIGMIAVVCIGTLAGALAPPTAGDALCYHLEIPKRFVEHGSIEYLPLTDNSLFPFQMEMLYTLALLLGLPLLAPLLHWLVGLLFGLAVVDLATPQIGQAAGRWAAVVAFLVPGVTNQMTAPLNDLAVALFCTLMLAAWVNWQTAWDNRHLALAGVWGGLAVGTKLVAAGFIGVVFLATMFVLLRKSLASGAEQLTNEPRGRNLFARVLVAGKSLGIFAMLVSMIGGIWYARSWYYLGNPIYPYFNSFFGLEAHTRSLLITARNPLTVPWLATMRPEYFGGRGVQFGAVFLAVLPGLVLVRKQPQVRALLGIALGFAAIWFAVRQELRFLLPCVGILAIAVMVVIGGLRNIHPLAFRATVLCVACLLVFQSLIVLKRARPCLAVACGVETRESYLERHEPSYRVARFVNEHLPRECRLISQDYRGFYFGPDFVREAALRRYWPYPERGDDLVRRLIAEHFTHILLVDAYNPDTAMYDEGFAERLGIAVAKLPLVFETHFESSIGDRRDYRLYELPAPPRAERAAN